MLPLATRRRDWRYGAIRSEDEWLPSRLDQTLQALHLHGRLAFAKGKPKLGAEFFAAAASFALHEARFASTWPDRYTAMVTLSLFARPEVALTIDGDAAAAEAWHAALEERLRELGGARVLVEGMLQRAVRDLWNLIDDAPDALGFRKNDTKERVLQQVFSIVLILREEGAVAAYESLGSDDSLLAILGGWLVANPKGREWQASRNVWHHAVLEGAGLEYWLGGGESFSLQPWHGPSLISHRVWAP